MAFIPTLNAIKLVLEFTIASQTVVVTISLGKASSVTPTDLANACNDGIQWLATELMPSLTDQLSLTQAVAYDLSSATAPVVFATPGSPVVGGDSSPALPNNATAVISWRTSNRGRSSRGRMYVPGLPTSAKTSATGFSSAFLAVLASAGAAMNSYFSPDGLEQVVISTHTGGSPRVAGLAQPVTSVVVDGLFDSQRRRLAGRGI